ncbi:GvpL/GvpF family gas vesicle protein [Thalassobacillus sp. C254]|uniref:GvpL/GvpF family gas vesicle protein n=1 Tax=Thalassobacillus sp. C254 TaxID=1225341 RepID=UPI0006D0F790|nr:GvpL/GvpF family gas vesicle protein [Thalassobacillus sp. C254]
MQTEANTKELIYLYAFVPTNETKENSLSSMTGIDPDYDIEFIEFNEVTAVTCLVKEEDFSEEVLQRKVDDMKWLQKHAFHHHEKMNALNEIYTVIPLKFGTIYEDKESLKEIVETHKENITSVFKELGKKEEWNIKIYTDKSSFTKEVEENSTTVKEKIEEIKDLPKGKQFFEKKKLKDFIEKQAEKEIDEYCESIHEQLTAYSSDEEVKKNWERKLTGRKDDMCWNGAYLFPKEEVERALQIIETEREKADKNETGFSYEVTGPWPAYHFSNFTERGE